MRQRVCGRRHNRRTRRAAFFTRGSGALSRRARSRSWVSCRTSVDELGVGDRGRVPPLGYVGRRAQVLEVADQVVAARGDLVDGPVAAVAELNDALRGRPELLALARHELALGEVAADPDAAVERLGEAGEVGVDAPQQLDLDHTERLVGLRPGSVAPGRVDAEQVGEPQPERLAGLGRLGQGQHVHALGRYDSAPPAQHVGDVERAPVPRVVRVGLLADGILVDRHGRAVLDELLPTRGDQAERVAGGENDVHLGPVERGDRALGLRGRGGGEELVADDRRTVPGVDLADEHVPRLRGLGVPLREVGLLADDSAGPQVLARAEAGQQNALSAKLVAVLPEDRLEVRRTGLGQPDVEEHSLSHAPAA